MEQHIAVVGAGPKAAAIAARAYCLRLTGVPIQVSIFEKHEIAAAWTGNHGYTDGIQAVCTPAARDVGFPYLPRVPGDVIPGLLKERFSWDAYRIELGDYADWIARGSLPPGHSAFAAYLKWVIEKAEAPPVIGEVTAVEEATDSWVVVQTRPDGKKVRTSGFHGVVFTGPGPNLKSIKGSRGVRYFTGVDYWTKGARFEKYATAGRSGVVIAGGGGTAAAICAHIARLGERAPRVIVLCKQGTFFTRKQNYFEDVLFHDETAWNVLGAANQQQFSDRLNRGTVWASVTDVLSQFSGLSFLPGEVRNVTTQKTTAGETQLEIHYVVEGRKNTLVADAFIDATGFDRGWFLKLLPKKVRDHIERETISKELRSDLSLDVGTPDDPKLHAPMYAQKYGPGLQSLMSTGTMASRILEPYVREAGTVATS